MLAYPTQFVQSLLLCPEVVYFISSAFVAPSSLHVSMNTVIACFPHIVAFFSFT